MRILVVEDDPVVGKLLQRGLEQARFDVDLTPDGAAGLRMGLEPSYGLIILDLMLPGKDGVSVCTELRRRRVLTPILMLTARDAVEDRVRGFEVGADDYLPKPFDFTELLARVRALLRRDKQHKGRVIRVGDLEIDTTSTRVRRAGAELSLTPREYALLEMLALHEGQVLTREAIQNRIWQDDDTFLATINVHVANLRKKVDAGHDVKLIHTIHGVGYSLRGPEETP